MNELDKLKYDLETLTGSYEALMRLRGEVESKIKQIEAQKKIITLKIEYMTEYMVPKTSEAQKLVKEELRKDAIKRKPEDWVTREKELDIKVNEIPLDSEEEINDELDKLSEVY
jgi:hypothetical protein